MKHKIDFELELRRNPYKGRYIVLEGIDGSGKSTQVERLGEYFKKQGKEVVLTREPRKLGLIGDLVQKVLLGEEKLPFISFQYLFSADRAAHHEELVEPALKQGKIVISDRNFWSALVYGILDRTGGVYDKKNLDTLLLTQWILSMYHQFIVPDYTFYLKIPLKTSLSRLSTKTEKKELYEDKDKIKKVLIGYEFLKEQFPDEITVIDGEQPVDTVTAELIDRIGKI